MVTAPQPDTDKTLPAWFWEVASRRGPAVALRWKHLGIWNDILWSNYADAARATGCALLAAGCQRGDRVAILSGTRPEWCYAEFGAQGAGACSVGVHDTCSAAELAYVLNDCAARWLFVQNQDQLEKALSVLEDTPGLEKIVYFDASGLHAFSHAKVMAFDTFHATGSQFHARHPAQWETQVLAVRAQDVATVAYTSGSAGRPKGVMLTHRNLLFQMQAMQALCPGMKGDDQLSFLSMSNIVERYFSVYRSLDHGAVVHLGKGLPTLVQNLREISPHVLMAVPRVWEKLYATVTMAVADSTPLARWAYRKALDLGRRVVDHRLAGQAIAPGLGLLYLLARFLVLRRVLAMIGMGRARLLISGAAPIAPDLLHWFLALNLPMVQAYGQTECAGHASSAAPGAQKAGSVGKAFAGTQVKLSAGGEVLVRGPHVFAGYLNQPERSARTLVDGWLHTGDLGQLDSDGYLTITERMKDIIAMSDGSKVMPCGIELRLKVSPYIADAIVIGTGRPYLSCLVMIDHESVAKRAREMDLAFTSFSSLTRSPEVRRLVQAEIDKANRDLAAGEKIHRFDLIDTEIGVMDPEMTPTLQLRRTVVAHKYRALVDALYLNAQA